MEYRYVHIMVVFQLSTNLYTLISFHPLQELVLSFRFNMKKKTEVKPVVQKAGLLKRNVIIIISLSILLLSILFFPIHRDKKQNNSLEEPSSESFAQGKALTLKHCQSCHMLPDPGLLDKDTWKKLLPEMGVSLGIQSPEVKVPEEDRSFYPAHPAMDAAQWQSILDYYHALAPASLPLQNKPAAPQQGSPFFAPLLPPEILFRSNTMVTCVRIDNSVKQGGCLFTMLSHINYCSLTNMA